MDQQEHTGTTAVTVALSFSTVWFAALLTLCGMQPLWATAFVVVGLGPACLANARGRP